MDNLNAFFQPNSVAIIGASRNPTKLGYGVARNMIRSGFRGKIYLVNPKGGEIFGRKVFTSIADVPEKVDLGLVVVPAGYVPETLIACSHKGIKHFIILTGGFSEIGSEGEKLEQIIAGLVRSEGLRVLGPNCIGVLDTHWPMDTTFIQPFDFTPGEVAFITHSGALGAAMIDWSRDVGLNFSRVVSLGNQIDVDESDVLLPTAKQEETAVVTMYLEGINDGDKFIRKAGEASRQKPVIALKVGRSAEGQKAAASHTGAIAGADHAFEAAFRKAGVLRASTTEQMFIWAKMFAWCQLPINNRIVVLTNAGGPGVTAVDSVADWGLVMADLSEETQCRLADILPEAASVGNPVDMLASASPEVYRDCLKEVLRDEGVDMVVVITSPPPMYDSLDVAEQIAEIINLSSKPVAVTMLGRVLVSDAVKYLQTKKIPVFSFPEDATSAMGALWAYRSVLKRDWAIHERQAPGEKHQLANEVIGRIPKASGFVDPEVTMTLLDLYDLPVVGLHFASSAESASDEAEKIGFPVVMKAAVEEVSHKSDLGGILLGLKSIAEVRDGFNDLRDRFREIGFVGEFGVHLQKMIPNGQEVIIGAMRDPIFGPMVMFGGGGTDVEGLRDVAFSLAPLSVADLDYLVENTWAGEKLSGFRNILPADIEKVKQLIVRVSQIMIDFPDIKEIEINPLIVLEKGLGEYIVDARMVV